MPQQGKCLEWEGPCPLCSVLWKADLRDHIDFLNLWLPFALSQGSTCRRFQGRRKEGWLFPKLSPFKTIASVPLPSHIYSYSYGSEFWQAFPPLDVQTRGGNGFLLLLALGCLSIPYWFFLTLLTPLQIVSLFNFSQLLLLVFAYFLCVCLGVGVQCVRVPHWSQGPVL